MPVNSQPEKSQKVIRQFGLTNLALKNKNSIYLLILILFGFGFYSYTSMPKELFPDIVIPTVLVQTAYPGNPPLDMENLVTRPIEKELEVITGVKEIASTSSQDISSIVVEFNTGVDLKQAVLDVKDAVDKAKSELPDDLPADPLVQDIDFSEFPIIYINLSGDYSLNELKKYAEYLEDEIETYSEISKVDIKGLNEREFSINVDPFKMEMLEISFGDIESAVGFENISMAAGQFREGDYRRSIRILGEFETAAQMGDIIVKSEKGNIVYLKDIAVVTDGFAEPKDFSRLNRQPVVTLHVIKKGGENLLSATDKIFDLLDRSKEDGNLPEGLNITITNDQSDLIRKQLDNLENSMIMGVILVVFVLFLFLGTRNALFVGFAIPLSMFISFLILNLMGYKLNMILLFSLILALGMLVDNAIVVMENIYRYFDRGYSRMEASRLATGEIAIAIISSTATTLAAF
nr:efflux RND transporter permease subunit [Bacteroidales bacterium]